MSNAKTQFLLSQPLFLFEIGREMNDGGHFLSIILSFSLVFELPKMAQILLF